MEPRNERNWVEKNGTNTIFQGHLCAVDSGLPRNSECYIDWTRNCKEKMASLEKRGIGVYVKEFCWPVFCIYTQLFSYEDCVETELENQARRSNLGVE